MSLRPSRRDVFDAFLYSLRRRLRNESIRTFGRLLSVVALCLIVGVVGSFILQRLPAPTLRFYARDEGCAYNAELASPLTTTVVQPGSVFNIQWFIRNTEQCPWGPDVTLQLRSGNLQVVTNTLSVINYAISPEARISGVKIGQDVAPLIPVTAPTTSGVYVTHWRLHAPGGQQFGPEFTYTIEVGAEAIGAPPPRAVVVPQPTIEPFNLNARL